MAGNKNNDRGASHSNRDRVDDDHRAPRAWDVHHGIVLTGGGEPDAIRGTPRRDTLDGGAGSDRIDGRPGNDLLIYNLSQNTGARDRYDGGAGSDTLRLVLTGAEWARADVKAEVLRLLAFMDARDHSGAEGEGSARWFSFESFGLEVRRIEKLEIIVDGLAVDPRGSGGGVDARDDAVTVGEDGSVAGNVLANDDGQISGVSLVSGPAQGQLQLNADGSFTYVPGAGFDSLGAGETALQSFTYRITDAQGNSDTATVNITIAGANDAPVFTTPELFITQAEGTHAIAWDLLDGAIDPDGDSVSLGAIGSLPPGVSLDGRYLSVDPSDPVYDGLAAGQSLTQSITYDVVDSGGGVTQRTVQITILGTNDLPVVGPVLDITASEDGMPISIRLTDGAFDPDSGAVLQAVNLNYPWPGISLIDSVLTLDPGAADYQSLNPLQSYSFQLAYDIVDDQGGYATEHGFVNVTVHGVNDAPVVYKDDLDVVQAEGSHSIAWDLLDGTTDIDLDDSLSVSLPDTLPPGMTLEGRYLHVDPAHPAYDYLAVGEARVVEVDYDVVDRFGGATRRTFTVTITGTNDVPVVTGADGAGSITELANNAPGENVLTHSVSGQVSFGDVDLSDSHIISVIPTAGGFRGTLTATVADSTTGDGSGRIDWHYSVSDAELDDLQAGQSQSQVYLIDILDGQGDRVRQQVTITLNGANENTPPVLNESASTLTASVREDGPTSVTGLLAASDVDAGDVLTWSITGGSRSHAPDFDVDIDYFRVTRNNVLFFEDGFGNGVPPPNAPPLNGGNPASYALVGTVTESGGRVHLDAANAVTLFGSGASALTGEVVMLTSDTTTSTTAGLKRTHDFTVSGRFDLFVPNDAREAYGIRLSDRITGKAGDDIIDLLVRRAPDGLLKVQMAEMDYVAGQYGITGTPAVELALPAEATQIQLNLSHQAANAGVVTASFDLYAGNRYLYSQTLVTHNAMRLFGTETPTDATDDEFWTRAGFVAYASASTDAFMAGEYGGLSIAPSGAWSYSLANMRPEVQALAETEFVTDSFEVATVDAQGASDTATVTVQIQGRNDAPRDIEGHLQCMITRDTPAGTVLGELHGVDIDNGATVSLSLLDSAGGRFRLEGNNLVLNTAFALTEPTVPLSVTVRATDEWGATFTKTFGFGVLDYNRAPTDILYTPHNPQPDPHYPEYMVPGTVLGRLWTVDPGEPGPHTYSIVDDPEGNFRIEDNNLVVNRYIPSLVWNTPEYTGEMFPIAYVSNGQIVTPYSVQLPPPEVTVRVTDSRGLTYDERITVKLFYPVGPSQVDIHVSDPWVYELTGAGNPVFAVGAYLNGATPTVTLEDSGGGPFALSGNAVDGYHVIQTSAINYETAPLLPGNYGGRGYLVTLHAQSGIFGTHETFAVRVLDHDEGLYPVRLSANFVLENNAPGSYVGGFYPAVDTGGGVQYSLINDAGGAFYLSGNQLRASRSFNFEENGYNPIMVHAEFANGDSYNQSFSISVVDMNEAPTNVFYWSYDGVRRDDSIVVPENAFAGHFIASLQVIDPDRFDSEWRYVLGGDTGGGKFYIDDNRLYLRGPLDYELQDYYDLNLSVVDAIGRGYFETFRLNVVDETGITFIAPQGDGWYTGEFEADTLIGYSGNQVFDGQGGNDTLQGGAGNDILRGGLGGDYLDGGDWFDANRPVTFDDIDYASYSSGVDKVGVNLINGVGYEYGNMNGVTDTLVHIEGLIGSRYDDVLAGGGLSAMEFFRGGEGNDLIYGLGGIDRAEYRDATGGIDVQLAAGMVSGPGVGVDTLGDIEEIEGSSFDDRFDARGFAAGAANFGSSGTLINGFLPGRGDDTIIGNGSTRLDYSNAEDCVELDLTTGVVEGSYAIGTDTFSGVSRVRGSAWADDFYGGTDAPTEYFEGMGGNDYIDGRDGYDIAGYSFDGNITRGINVDLGLGIITGDLSHTGIDTLRSIESVDGTALTDLFDASRFSDRSPNAGSLLRFNEFQGRGGNDTLIGNGYTRASYADSTGAVNVDLAAGTAIGDTSVGTDHFQGGVSAIAGSQFDDQLHGDAGANSIEGRWGNDSIDGRGGGDNLAGGGGSDTFLGHAGTTFDFILDFHSGVGTDHDVLDLRGLGVSSVSTGLWVENLLGGAAIWRTADMSPVVVLLGLQASPSLLDNLHSQGNLLI